MSESTDVIEPLPANLPLPWVLRQSGADPACGPVAAEIRSRIENYYSDRARSGWLIASGQLEDAWNEARVGDWGGEGEEAMTVLARQNALSLLQAVKDSVPLPEITPDPRGGVALEWYVARGRSLAAAISNDGTLHYSLVLGERSQLGAEPMRGEVPAPFLAALDRLYACVEDRRADR